MIKNSIKLTVTTSTNLVNVLFEDICDDSEYELNEVSAFTKLSDDQQSVVSIIVVVTEECLDVEQISGIVYDTCETISNKYPSFRSCLNNRLMLNM